MKMRGERCSTYKHDPKQHDPKCPVCLSLVTTCSHHKAYCSVCQDEIKAQKHDEKLAQDATAWADAMLPKNELQQDVVTFQDMYLGNKAIAVRLQFEPKFVDALKVALEQEYAKTSALTQDVDTLQKENHFYKLTLETLRRDKWAATQQMKYCESTVGQFIDDALDVLKTRKLINGSD